MGIAFKTPLADASPRQGDGCAQDRVVSGSVRCILGTTANMQIWGRQSPRNGSLTVELGALVTGGHLNFIDRALYEIDLSYRPFESYELVRGLRRALGPEREEPYGLFADVCGSYERPNVWTIEDGTLIVCRTMSNGRIVARHDSLTAEYSRRAANALGGRWEVACEYGCTVNSAPYWDAPAARVAGTPWQVRAGQRITATGFVAQRDVALTREGFWRVSDGTRIGYVDDAQSATFYEGEPWPDAHIARRVLGARFERAQREVFRERSFVVMTIYPNGPNSAGGVGATIMYRNMIAGKRIKYVRFVVVSYNAVGDRVADRISGSAIKILRVTGPLDPISPEDADIEGSWGPVWYNRSITCLRLERVEIEFMDGTRRTSLGSDASIRHPDFSNTCAVR